jgi:hypothetical protein
MLGDPTAAVAGPGDHDQPRSDPPGQQVTRVPIQRSQNGFVDHTSVGVDGPHAVHRGVCWWLLHDRHRQTGTDSGPIAADEPNGGEGRDQRR